MNNNFSIAGIGLGPSNLSLAALLHPLKNLNGIFFEKKAQFDWHSGMQLPGTKLQVHFLKDLVTLVDPTNPYSFLSFLAKQKRLYQFINADFDRVSRTEFSQYYQWAANQLPNIEFNSPVREISVQDNYLQIHTNNNISNTKNVILGTGLTPKVPANLKHLTCDTLFHANEFMRFADRLNGKRILIVGGGQTGAEVALHFLNKPMPERNEVIWVSRRDNFLPIDESPFVNELFTPAYSNHFYNLPFSKKQKLIARQKLFSDGISPHTLTDIYQRIYEIKFLTQDPHLCNLIPSSDLLNVQKETDGWCAFIKNTETDDVITVKTDVVILCTGYQYELPGYMTQLQNRFHKQRGHFVINNDYSLQWDGPADCKFYIQNGALASRGVADPNLSLAAWRSAIIINSIVGQQIYDTSDNNSFFNWQHAFPQQENIFTEMEQHYA